MGCFPTANHLPPSSPLIPLFLLSSHQLIFKSSRTASKNLHFILWCHPNQLNLASLAWSPKHAIYAIALPTKWRQRSKFKATAIYWCITSQHAGRICTPRQVVDTGLHQLTTRLWSERGLKWFTLQAHKYKIDRSWKTAALKIIQDALR